MIGPFQLAALRSQSAGGLAGFKANPALHETRRGAPLRVLWAGLVLATCTQATARGLLQIVPNARAHADRGIQLARAGNLADAEMELRRAVELAPNDPEYLTDLGTILAMQKKLEESTASFTKALKLDPGDLTARRYVAANLWQLHRLEEARRNLETVLKATPDDRPSVLLLGMVAENLNDYATAAKLLASVPELVHQQPESVAALARSYYHTNETAKARETLETLLHGPLDPRGVFLGGRIAAEMRDFDTAVKLYEAIRSTYPDRAVLGYNLALAQYDGQHFGDARQTLLDLLGAGYQSGEIYNLLGWCYEKENRKQEGIQTFEDAISRDPSKEQNYLDLGKASYDVGLFTDALGAAKRALAVHPNSHDAYMLKGDCEFRLSQFTDAIASYARAAELDRAEPQANLGIARAQPAAGMAEAAKRTFEDGIKRFPQDARHHLDYALLLLGLAEAGSEGARSQAEAQLKMALALDSHLYEADYQLGSMALESGRLSEAVNYLQAAGRLDPDKSKTHFALARAYRRLGQREDVAQEMALFQKLKSQEERKLAPTLSAAGMEHD
jgi:tetratricopeptide (TPR) repeat protein